MNYDKVLLMKRLSFLWIFLKKGEGQMLLCPDRLF